LTRVGNFCDDGFPSGGSYWSNYVSKDVQTGQHQNEPGSDGIGDLPYAIARAAVQNDILPIGAQKKEGLRGKISIGLDSTSVLFRVQNESQLDGK